MNIHILPTLRVLVKTWCIYSIPLIKISQKQNMKK